MSERSYHGATSRFLTEQRNPREDKKRTYDVLERVLQRVLEVTLVSGRAVDGGALVRVAVPQDPVLLLQAVRLLLQSPHCLQVVATRLELLHQVQCQAWNKFKTNNTLYIFSIKFKTTETTEDPYQSSLEHSFRSWNKLTKKKRKKAHKKIKTVKKTFSSLYKIHLYPKPVPSLTGILAKLWATSSWSLAHVGSKCVSHCQLL